MIVPMRTRLAIFGHPLITGQLREVAAEFGPALEVRLVDQVLLSEAVALARQWEAESAVDVFVSGGANAALLKQSVTLPVVAFRVNSLDLLAGISRAMALSPVVPVVTYGEPLHGLGEVSHLFRVRVLALAYASRDELPKRLDEARRLGARAVVGSSLVCECAAAAGMHGVLIYSRASFREAIANALDLAAARQRELERAERFKAILDFAYSGIVATDEDGRITVFNPVAEKIVGVSARDAMGRRLDEAVGPDCSLIPAIRARQTELNQVHRIGRGEVLASHVPIVVEGQARGCVLTFQDAAVIQRGAERLRGQSESRGLTARYTLADVVGESPGIRSAIDKAARYARVDSTVLIEGETGTGKELFAQGIHNASCRQDGPFVAINCAALPEALLESELFGYEEGAFTGARKGGKPGLFELASRGTIFLDEIGELSPGLQARLLRVLQQRQVMRVGGDRVIPVDVRVIAATHRDLRAEVTAGRFRRDLFFRLDVLRLTLPPLRERIEDVPLLVETILRRFDPVLATELRPLLGRVVPVARLYTWPGNVRELENVVERFAVTIQGSSLSPREALVRFLTLVEEHISGSGTSPRGVSGRPGTTASRPTSPDDIRRMVALAGGNRSEAARRLGISRTTLYRKLRESK